MQRRAWAAGASELCACKSDVWVHGCYVVTCSRVGACLASVGAWLAGGLRVLGSLPGDVCGEPIDAGELVCSRARWRGTSVGARLRVGWLGDGDRSSRGWPVQVHRMRVGWWVLCMAQVAREGNHVGLCACLLG